MPNVQLSDGVYTELAEFRKTEKGTVTFSEAVGSLLRFWQTHHK